jgi:endonuclease YncB( thermonuclease family)
MSRNESLVKDLINIKNDDINEFSLAGQKLQGKIVDIYDGDTCKIVLIYDNKLLKFSCRLLGLDTPEMKPSKTKPDREKEILDAHKCRNKLLQLTTSCNCDINQILKKTECASLLLENTKIITVECHEFDKYGRLLVELYVNGDNCNNLLIKEGYAKAYDGGTKDIFTY